MSYDKHTRNSDMVMACKRDLLTDIAHIFRMEVIDRVKRQMFCNRCGRKVFGPGSLYRIDEWGEDVCRCDSIGFSDVSIVQEGLLWIWKEEEIGCK